MSAEQPKPLPPSLQANPQLDDWIRIDPGGTITVRTGKVELGQGITTAVAMIAAEELDVALARIRVETADSARAPNEWMTVGSMSIESTGPALRLAAAEARLLLLERAAARLDSEPGALVVEDGVVKTPDGARSISYWELMPERARFGCAVSGRAQPKPPGEHKVVGRRAQRIDIARKAFGAQRFVNDLQLPGMLHGRVVRPKGPGAQLRAAPLDPVRAMPGVVAVVRDGSFLGVVAEREEQALAAAEALRAGAQFEPAALPPAAGQHERLVADVIGSYPLVDGIPREQPVPPRTVPEGALHTIEARYLRPFLMHASIGPSAALAQFVEDRLEVHCASQGVSILALALAQVLRMDVARIRVVHAEGAGCYGHNGSDDAALDAALLARAVPGRAVLLKWSRQDEHVHEPYGPAMRVDVQASVDAAGRIVGFSHDVYSYTHIGRAFPGRDASALIAAHQLAEPWKPPKPRAMLAPEAGIHRNALPPYTVPAPRVIKHLCAPAPLRTSSLRSLGAFTNVFAIESMMDELAAAAGIDPLRFRLAHLTDERARAVIEAGADRFGFREPKPAGDPQRPRGRGMAYSRYENHKCYAAVFVELEVDLSRCAIQLLRAVIAADAGLVVDPDGLENQLEGGFVQAASFTLKEQVTWDAEAVTSLDWASYPILTFEEVPPVEVVILDRRDRTSRGAGEATTGPTPAAIANAVFDACGVRLRETPFTEARVRAALYAG